MAAHHIWGLASRTKMMLLDSRWPPMLDDILRVCPFDITLVWTYRGRLAQERAFAEGTSTKQWPDSVHNTEPSKALDLAPYIDGQIDWGREDHGRRYYIIGGIVWAVAEQHGHEVRSGMDWDRDGDLDDQRLIDLGHWEVLEQDRAP